MPGGVLFAGRRVAREFQPAATVRDVPVQGVEAAEVLVGGWSSGLAMPFWEGKLVPKDH